MKPFTMAAVIIFALVAVLQLLRLFMGWEVAVNGVAVPVWASGTAFVIAGGLAGMLWQEARRRTSVGP